MRSQSPSRVRAQVNLGPDWRCLEPSLWCCCLRTARDELLAAIRRQVEYYSSKENLQSDAFLVSNMDATMSVPINVVIKVKYRSRLLTLVQSMPCLAGV